MSLFENVHLQLGYEDSETDNTLTILLRRDINNWLCNFDNSKCVTRYTDKFRKWKINEDR